MRKQISIIFTCLVCLSVLAGCGVKRGLYQKPEKPPVENAETDTNNSKEPTLHQQEKR